MSEEPSMIQTLMQLPLFHGVSYELMHEAIEHLILDFSQYEAGYHLIKTGDPCAELSVIIEGEARVVRSMCGGKMLMSQRVGAGTMLMADRLMGLYTNYDADVYAGSRLSLMKIGKQDFLRLLGSHQIFLYNYLNYLSFKAQIRAGVIVTDTDSDKLQALLRKLWIGLGERRALSTTYNTHIEFLSAHTGMEREQLLHRMAELIKTDNADLRLSDNGSLRLTLFTRPD
ncbi:MAG: cyclic nucleotide-binding domain-containing protein [Muribaculaceae bacterium]|nr:cyclic nucleotide-binding domain-containing protein [Muribaculaceae bacterium]